GIDDPGRAPATSTSAGINDPGSSDNVIAVEPRGWRRFLPFLLVLFFLALFVRLVCPTWFNLPADPNTATQNTFVRCVTIVSIVAIPFLLSFFPFYYST